jgi:hypothetical protein
VDLLAECLSSAQKLSLVTASEKSDGPIDFKPSFATQSGQIRALVESLETALTTKLRGVPVAAHLERQVGPAPLS